MTRNLSFIVLLFITAALPEFALATSTDWQEFVGNFVLTKDSEPLEIVRITNFETGEATAKRLIGKRTQTSVDLKTVEAGQTSKYNSVITNPGLESFSLHVHFPRAGKSLISDKKRYFLVPSSQVTPIVHRSFGRNKYFRYKGTRFYCEFQTRAGDLYCLDSSGKPILIAKDALVDLSQIVLPEFESYFEDIRSGRPINFFDNKQLAFLFLYVSTQMRHTQYYGNSLRILFEKLIEFAKRNPTLPAKPQLASLLITTLTGKKLRLRILPTSIAAFRGCLGDDCSSKTRLPRAFEPAHLNFAIEAVPYEPLGQVEIVLGRSENHRIAFLERIQSPKNLKDFEIAGVLVGLHQLMHELGAQFSIIPISWYQKFGHPISNSLSVVKATSDAINDQNFIASRIIPHFVRDPDVLNNGDDGFFNLVAESISSQSGEVAELTPIKSIPAGIASIEYEPPRTIFPSVDWVALSKKLSDAMAKHADKALSDDWIMIEELLRSCQDSLELQSSYETGRS